MSSEEDWQGNTDMETVSTYFFQIIATNTLDLLKIHQNKITPAHRSENNTSTWVNIILQDHGKVIV